MCLGSIGSVSFALVIVNIRIFVVILISFINSVEHPYAHSLEFIESFNIFYLICQCFFANGNSNPRHDAYLRGF